MSINFNQFLNTFDIFFLVIIFISFLFGIKNGLIKSLLNLIKWVIIFYTIKKSFTILRSFLDPFITNQTLSDIFIFFSTLIVTYVLITFVNRLIIGVLQPRKSFFIDLSFGGLLGILRGYIIFVLIIFFLNNNLSSGFMYDLFENGTFHEIVNYGVNFLGQMPRNLNKIQDINF